MDLQTIGSYILCLAAIGIIGLILWGVYNVVGWLAKRQAPDVYQKRYSPIGPYFSTWVVDDRTVQITTHHRPEEFGGLPAGVAHMRTERNRDGLYTYTLTTSGRIPSGKIAQAMESYYRLHVAEGDGVDNDPLATAKAPGILSDYKKRYL